MRPLRLQSTTIRSLWSALDVFDAIRFVAAIWVVLSHNAAPLKPLFSDPIARLAAGAFESTFSGISAVMVFFIVSGFCIHLPYTDARSVPITKFLIRRYIRIGIPLIAVLLLTPVVGAQAEIKMGGVLWSVYAELVYYSIYPMLFYAARRFGWRVLIITFSAISLSLVLLHLEYINVQQFGWLTWLWGLPIWLSGCLLAEFAPRRHVRLGPRSIICLAYRRVGWRCTGDVDRLPFTL